MPLTRNLISAWKETKLLCDCMDLFVYGPASFCLTSLLFPHVPLLQWWYCRGVVMCCVTRYHVGVSCAYRVKTCRIKPLMRSPWGIRLLLNAHKPVSLFLISACVPLCVSYLLDRVLPGTPVSLLQILHVQPKFGQAELLDVEFIIRSTPQRWHALARWWERWRKDRNKRTKHENRPFVVIVYTFFFIQPSSKAWLKTIVRWKHRKVL